MPIPRNPKTNPIIEKFLQHCRVRRYPNKTTIIHAGDSSDMLYFLISGSVAVLIEDDRGNEIVLAYLNRSEFFGEMGLFLDEAKRTAWVCTRSESEIAEISYAKFRQIAQDDPRILFELSGQMAARLANTSRKVSDLAFLDVTGRIASTLLDLCKGPDSMSHPEGTQLRISRQELARIVGCSREMAGRVIKSLEEEGLISASGKTLVVFHERGEQAPLAER